MRYSSANQLQLQFDNNAQPTDASDASAVSADSFTRMPDFRYDPEIAAANRMAGRLNAARIADHELDELLRQRARLVDKVLEGIATRQEKHKLDYIQWTLDRIEDARLGHTLDALEKFADHYQAFADDLSAMRSQLEGAKKKR